MRAPHRAGQAVVRRTRKRLSDRELAVIESVERFRYLSARQIEELLFHDHATPLTGARTCRKVLGRLTEASILWRLERRIGGVRAGSSSYRLRRGPLRPSHPSSRGGRPRAPA